MAAQALAGSRQEEGRRRWPAHMSAAATMGIGTVWQLLAAEYDDVTVSKLRFLEERGLVFPTRTPAGYRKFSQADIERLRFILRAQRDAHLPLRVIGEQLAELDENPYSPAPDLTVGRHTLDRGTVSVEDVARAAGCPLGAVERLVAEGLLQVRADGRLPAQAIRTTEAAEVLAAHGIQTRHLRSLLAALSHEAHLIDQVIAPIRAQQQPGAEERAQAVLQELVQALVTVHETGLQAELSSEDG